MCQENLTLKKNLDFPSLRQMTDSDVERVHLALRTLDCRAGAPSGGRVCSGRGRGHAEVSFGADPAQTSAAPVRSAGEHLVELEFSIFKEHYSGRKRHTFAQPVIKR